MNKKLLALLFALVLLTGILAGCNTNTGEGTQTQEECLHRWQPATCMSGKICTICGVTLGDPVDHNYGQWLPNGNGTHTRACAYNDAHTETASCFGESVPEKGDVCPDCGYVADPDHVHTYDKQVVGANYKAADATCAHGTGYYYTCSCGLVGTEIFYAGQTLDHTEVVDPAVQATFSVSGLTEGSHCGVCGAVIKAQLTVPALGSDVAVGTDYYDKEGQITYRYSYSFTVYGDNRFNLTTLKVGSDDTYQLTGEDGTLNFLDNGIYELVFDSGRETMYGKIHNGKFEFCDRDGGKWKDKESRPHGSTAITITPRAGNSVYGYNDLANNPHGQAMQELYYRLYAACEAFVTNREDIASHNGKYSGKHIIDRINLEYYVLNTDDAVATWKVFYMENPRYYWLSNTFSITNGVLEVCIDPQYADGAHRTYCDTSIDAMAAECTGMLTENMSQLDKALEIHDYIIRRMNYAYKADGKTPEDLIWAHNMTGCATNLRSGVCESYAKTYQYLCLLNGLDCLIVTGYNSGNHAWNLVKIDGEWYGVDCTFDETGTSEVSYKCFGMSAGRMVAEYDTDSPNKKGVDYLYQLPEIAQHGVELVVLYKDGNQLGRYANIDKAFGAMTDANGEYEVQLFVYNVQGPLLLGAADVEHRICSTQTPVVKRLTIRGNRADLGNDFSRGSVLHVDSDLLLMSELHIYDLDITGQGSLNIAGNSVVCAGFANSFSIPVSGSLEESNPSVIEALQTQQLAFYAPLSIHSLLNENQDEWCQPVFHDTVYIVQVYSNGLWFLDADEPGKIVIIENWDESRYGGIRRWGPSLTIHGGVNVTVNHIGFGDFRIEAAFAEIENFANVTIGSVDGKVKYVLLGEITSLIYDVDGNLVNTIVKKCDPADLQGPIATLKDPATLDKMEIYFAYSENGGETNHTSDYMLNSQNEVVLKDQ